MAAFASLTGVGLIAVNLTITLICSSVTTWLLTRNQGLRLALFGELPSRKAKVCSQGYETEEGKGK